MKPYAFRGMLQISLMPIAFTLFCSPSYACNLEILVTRAISNLPILTWEDAVKNVSGNQINLMATLGEYEPGSIVIRNKSGICTNVNFKVDALSLSGQPEQIDNQHIDIKYVKKWFQGGSAWKDIGSKNIRKLTPELLLNNPKLIKVDSQLERNYLLVRNSQKTEYLDISTYASKRGRETPSIDQIDVQDSVDLQPTDINEEAQQLFLTFFAPENARPGIYQSTLRIMRNQAALLTVPIRFEILPFKLDAPQIEYSIFYRGQLTEGVGTISSEQKNENQYRADLINMLKHGISNPNIYQSFDNKATLKKALEVRRNIGFTQPSIYYLGKSASTALTPSTREELLKVATTMRQICRPLGYTNLYFFGADEATGEKLHRQLPSWQYARTSLGLNVFTTGYRGTFDSVGSQLDLFILAGEPQQGEISKFHTSNKRVMTYAYPQSGPEDPELFRRNYGINLWAQGVDGAMMYAYQDSFGFIWNDFDHEKYRDHNFVYPTSTGAIDTLAWEGVREAIDDVRYLTTLKNIMDKIQNNCTSQQCITMLSKEAIVLETSKIKTNQRDLDDTRKKIAAAIQNLLPLYRTISPPTPPKMSLPST